MTGPTESRRSPPQAWLDTLARAREDVAAGRTHDFETAMRAFEAEDAEWAAELDEAEKQTRAAAR